MNISNLIISKLEEKIAFRKDTVQGKAARATAADALRSVKKRFKTSGLAKKPGDAAKLTKQYSQETYKHRESIAAILSDKLEELSQKTIDSAAAKRVAQVRSKDFRGEEKPVFKGGTGGTDKAEKIGTRSSAGKGVIGKRLATLYKGRTSKGVAKRREDSSINLKDLMVDILMETYRRSGYGSSRRRRETPRERQDRLDYEHRDNYWSGRTDSHGNVNPDKVAPGGSDEGHKDSPEGHR